MNTYIQLRMLNITKSFPGVKALDKANLDLNKGEVHALVGENGAGKSTLIKVLTGLYQKDSGNIILEKKEINPLNTYDSRRFGISAIYQEIDFIPIFSISENIFLGKEPCRTMGKIDYSKLNEETQKIMNYLELNFDVTQSTMFLNTGQQQLLMIARALADKAKIIIMDEVTATFSVDETNHLFKIINDLKKKGISIIYISHRLEEIFKIADRVTVMRDGKTVCTKNVSETNLDELISLMIGKQIKERFVKEEIPIGNKIILTIKNFSLGETIKNVSFNLYKNEILGFGGLVGSGRSELMKLLFGIDKKEGGQIFLNGKEVFIHNSSDAIKEGIALIPEERRVEGLVLNMDVRENMTLSCLKNFCILNNIIMLSKERELVKRLIGKLSIKTPSTYQRVKFLSGGNQQKVIIAKWLASKASVFIFDEPTKGVDVGAKKEIYTLISEIIKEGASIILISSDLSELIALSDRILVMSRGEIKGELTRDDASMEKILYLSTS